MSRRARSAGDDSHTTPEPEVGDVIIRAWYLTNKTTRRNAHYFIAVMLRAEDDGTTSFYVAVGWGSASVHGARTKVYQKADWDRASTPRAVAGARRHAEKYATVIMNNKIDNGGYKMVWYSTDLDIDTIRLWYETYYSKGVGNKPWWWLQDESAEVVELLSVKRARRKEAGDYVTADVTADDMEVLTTRMRDELERKKRKEEPRGPKVVRRVGRFKKVRR